MLFGSQWLDLTYLLVCQSNRGVQRLFSVALTFISWVHTIKLYKQRIKVISADPKAGMCALNWNQYYSSHVSSVCLELKCKMYKFQKYFTTIQTIATKKKKIPILCSTGIYRHRYYDCSLAQWWECVGVWGHLENEAQQSLKAALHNFHI